MDVTVEKTIVIKLSSDEAAAVVGLCDLGLARYEDGNSEITHYGNRGVPTNRGRATTGHLKSQLLEHLPEIELAANEERE